MSITFFNDGLFQMDAFAQAHSGAAVFPPECVERVRKPLGFPYSFACSETKIASAE